MSSVRTREPVATINLSNRTPRQTAWRGFCGGVHTRDPTAEFYLYSLGNRMDSDALFGVPPENPSTTAAVHKAGKYRLTGPSTRPLSDPVPQIVGAYPRHSR